MANTRAADILIVLASIDTYFAWIAGSCSPSTFGHALAKTVHPIDQGFVRAMRSIHDAARRIREASRS